MKIGILTFHFAHNCGAMLQAYALSRKLCQLGYDAELIDYRPSFMDDNIKRKSFFKFLDRYKSENRIIAFLKGVKNYPRHYVKDKSWHKFELFLKTYLKKSNRVYEVHQICTQNYDAIICGSDQIWNRTLTGSYLPLYFCQNIPENIIKISYAASNGCDSVDESDLYEFRKLIANFNHVSIRESGLSDFLNSKDIINTTVLDPVFLLNKNEWYKIALRPKELDYVLLFSFRQSEKLVEKAIEVGKQLNKQIIYYNFRYIDNVPSFIKQISDGGPREFLGYLANASFIVTNSFHGTAFSIVLQKDFICVPPSKGRERTDSLLKKFGLFDRCSEDDSNVVVTSSIDKAKFINGIKEPLEISLNFLLESLNAK